MADLEDVVRELSEIKNILKNDRAMMWKLLFTTIIGSFALVGIKLFV